MKVLFICKGNVGRSQMAEAFYNKLSKNEEVFSTGAKNYHRRR
jgi:protein-tyrosine-phosphatase